jgi:hypothetical protein
MLGQNYASQKVFFFTTSSEWNSKKERGAWFQDLIVNLAEGFKELGVQYYSSNNYWRLYPDSDQYLIQHRSDVMPNDCDIVILERQWFEENGCLPKDLFNPSRKYITVYLDCADGITTSSWLPEFRQFDFIFKTHYIKRFKYPSNIYPWAFGLSNRVLKELIEFKEPIDKNGKILANFRHNKHAHSVRKYIEKKFISKIGELFPIDSTIDDISIPPSDPYHHLRWMQTGRRHYPSYYKRLQESTACAAFGGFFLAPKLTDFNPRLSYYSSRVVDKLGVKTNRIVQWDSWRFWESLAAGCVTFHLDFQKYGFVLPTPPINWEHYIGIDLDNIHVSLEKIREQPELVERISIQGRNWAIQNYSPEAVSKRFLETVLSQGTSRAGFTKLAQKQLNT